MDYNYLINKYELERINFQEKSEEFSINDFENGNIIEYVDNEQAKFENFVKEHAHEVNNTSIELAEFISHHTTCMGFNLEEEMDMNDTYLTGYFKHDYDFLINKYELEEMNFQESFEEFVIEDCENCNIIEYVDNEQAKFENFVKEHAHEFNNTSIELMEYNEFIEKYDKHLEDELEDMFYEMNHPRPEPFYFEEYCYVDKEVDKLYESVDWYATCMEYGYEGGISMDNTDLAGFSKYNIEFY